METEAEADVSSACPLGFLSDDLLFPVMMVSALPFPMNDMNTLLGSTLTFSLQKQKSLIQLPINSINPRTTYEYISIMHYTDKYIQCI